MVKLKYKGLRTFKGVPCGIGALQRFYGISRYQYKLYLSGGLKGVFSDDKHNRIERAVELENLREDSLKQLALQANSQSGKVDGDFMKKVEETAMMPLTLTQLYMFLTLEKDE
jgi:hypothetical protein